MTEDVQQEVKTEDVPAINPRREAMIRFNEHCAIMVRVLHSTPIHPTLRSYANMNFDQFAFWVREGINQIPEVVEPTPEAVPFSEAVTEPTSSTES